MDNVLAASRNSVLITWYGLFAKSGTPALVNLMVVSDDLSYGEVFTVLENASVTLGRPVNPTILSRDEFRQRMVKHESFLTRVMEQPKIWIVGGEETHCAALVCGCTGPQQWPRIR